MRRVVLAIGAATTLWACGGGTPPSSASNSAASKAAAAAPATTPPATGGAAGAGYFTVPADQMPHLKIAPVRKTTWSAVVRTTGTVDWDNDQTTQAITQVSGPITRIVADTGTRVKAGDPLLYVASADITNSISTYRKAKNRFDLAQHSLDRSKDLFDHKALSQRDLESALPQCHGGRETADAGADDGDAKGAVGLGHWNGPVLGKAARRFGSAAATNATPPILGEDRSKANLRSAGPFFLFA